VHKALLDVLDHQHAAATRLADAAGRTYLPEYRAVREKAGDFLKLCFTPELAAEVTLQPVRRFGFDAAILFSGYSGDPHALGQRSASRQERGRMLDPIADRQALTRLEPALDHSLLAPVYQAIRLVKSALAPDVALLGFCGAPWTVASYMIAGHGTPDQQPARMFCLRRSGSVCRFDGQADRRICGLSGPTVPGPESMPCKSSIPGPVYCQQMNLLGGASIRRNEIIAKVRSQVPAAKVIGFPRGVGAGLLRYVEDVPVDAVGLDWTADLAFVRDQIQWRVPVQGNLDPLALLAGGAALDRGVDNILAAFSGRPFIFNLGHGILPQTPIAHVEQMLARVRRG
jgi:uroporphyrinogen decarboxylase